jgi:TolB protein
MSVITAVTAAGLLSCSPPTRDPCALDAPGADWLAYASRRAGDYDLRISRADGACDRALTSGPGDDLFPTWSPSGQVAYTAVRETGVGIRVRDVATGADRPLDVGPLYASSPAFSPDGSHIAFEAHLPGTAATDVYVVSAAGGTPVQLTDLAADDAGPVWAPDGKSIFFVSLRTGWYDVFSVSAAGGAATQVTTGSGILGKPAVSPDGQALVYARASAGTGLTEVVRLDLEAGTTTVVTADGDSEPAFDAGGGRLAVRSLRFGNPEIVIVDSAGSGSPLRLTYDDAADGAPAFAPAGVGGR